MWLGVALAVGLPIAVAGSLLTGNASFGMIGTVIGLVVGSVVMRRYLGVRD
jgi:hypothetical protein